MIWLKIIRNHGLAPLRWGLAFGNVRAGWGGHIQLQRPVLVRKCRLLKSASARSGKHQRIQ